MRKQVSLRRRLLWLLGPSLVCILFNFLMFQSPIQRESSQLLEKMNRLSAAMARYDSATDSQRLVFLKAEAAALASQLEDHKTSRTHFIARRGDLTKTILGSTVPATAIAEMIELLEQHNLKCVSAQPSNQPQAKLPEALQAVAGNTAAQGSSTDQCAELQIAIQGTFHSMQHALRDLKSDSSGVRLVSLEMMDSVGVQSELRSWLLTVAMGRSRP